jgi:PAS domain S-box-containing protein
MKRFENPGTDYLEQVEALYNLVQAVSRADSLAAIYRIALDSLQTTLGVERAAVLLFDPQGKMGFEAWRGLSAAYRQAVAGHSPWSVTETEPRSLVINEAAGEPSLASLHAILLAEGIHSLAFIPLFTTQGQLLGKLMLYTSTPRPLTEQDILLAETIAGHVAFAIERQRREEALHHSQQELSDFVENAAVCLHWVGADGTILWANQAELDFLGYSRDEYIGHPIAEFHADRPIIEHILQRLSRNETLLEYEARLRCKDGSIRHVAISSNVMREAGRFIHTRCFTRDITARKLAEEALQAANAELEQRVTHRTAQLQQEVIEREQAEATVRALLRISEKLNATLDLEQLMDTLTCEAIQLVGAESGFSGLTSPAGFYTHRYFQGSQPIPFEYTFVAGEGLIGSLMTHKVPVICNDVQAQSRVVSVLQQGFHVRSLLCTPILDQQNEVVGFFEVTNKRGDGHFNESDAEKLAAAAHAAAIAIQNARLFEDVKMSHERLRYLTQQVVLAQEEERQRISRELHDSAGQLLTALNISLGLVLQDIPAELNGVGELLHDSRQMAHRALDEVRTLAHSLRPPVLERPGLNHALESLCQDFTRLTRLPIQYQAEPLPPLPDIVQISFYRFLQEGLTNTAKHAAAQTVRVHLTCDFARMMLSIEDDGQGFRWPEVASGRERRNGIGLLGMQERFDILGGQLQIFSQPGQGTRLVASYPLNNH